METILITGGTGFFGKSILSMIKSGFLSNYNFIILSRNPDKFLQNNSEFNNIKNVTYIFGDITNFNYNNYNIDYILHAATSVDQKVSDKEMYQTIVDGTNNILNFAHNCYNLKNLLYISSGGIYGNNLTKNKISENDTPQPFTVYGKAKLEAEEICLNSKLPITISRCFAFTGKYLNKNSTYAIGNFIKNCLNNEPIIINGDGTTVRSYLYAEDLINWLFTLLFNNKVTDIFNIGSDIPISIKDLAYLIKKILNSNSDIIIKNIISEKTSSYYIPDITKIKNKFNLNINTSLADAILKSI